MGCHGNLLFPGWNGIMLYFTIKQKSHISVTNLGGTRYHGTKYVTKPLIGADLTDLEIDQSKTGPKDMLIRRKPRVVLFMCKSEVSSPSFISSKDCKRPLHSKRCMLKDGVSGCKTSRFWPFFRPQQTLTCAEKVWWPFLCHLNNFETLAQICLRKWIY